MCTAGMSPEFMKSRLIWMGNSFQMYLRDTGIIQDNHCNILQLQTACDEVIDLINDGLNQHTTNPEVMIIVDPESKHEMGANSVDMD